MRQSDRGNTHSTNESRDARTGPRPESERAIADAVLSNDRFKDRIARFPDVRDRIIRYMIVAGEVVLERRAKRRGH